MTKNTLRIIDTIVDQHAEEAVFLWFQRAIAVYQPHYDLSDLAELDDRLEAHIDGLCIAGDEGWEICKQELAWQEAGEVFTAALLAFESGIEERIEEALKIGAESAELSRGIISALGWLDFDKAKPYIDCYVKSTSPDLQRIAIAASAIQRKDPGEALVTAIKSENMLLKARALKAAGELGRIDLLPYLQYEFRNQDSLCRFWAAWSAALFKEKSAIEILKAIDNFEPAHQETEVKSAVRLMEVTEAHDWLNRLKQNPAHLRFAIIASGALGDPAAISWLLEMTSNNEVARAAGEAFTMITGVDLAYDDLEGEWPEGFEAGPTENPEDEDVEMDVDEDLPWPEPELINKWWAENKNKFQNGARYLLGEPITPDWLQQVLRNGKQRQRAAAAIELAMASPGQPLFEVRAPGFRQKKILNQR